MIGGNITAELQTCTTTENRIGEPVEAWQTAQELKGWLDLQTGEVRHTYSAGLEESTHVFVCDYVALDEAITAENSRLIVKGKEYAIKHIDNPMELNKQLEIYLKYTGGQ